MRQYATIIASLALIAACKQGNAHPAQQGDTTMAHMDHGTTHDSVQAVPNDTSLPADASGAMARLNASPRHGEYVMLPTPKGDSLRAWITYPSRSTPAPVVIVIPEIFGMTSWLRGVADQIAAAGYIAIVPDLLTSQNLPGAPDNVSTQDGIAATSKLNPDDVQSNIDVAAKYAMAQPSALKQYAIIGFCWGGGVAFQHAVHSPTVKTAVVYYGTSPETKSLTSIKAPIIGFYGGNDNRVVATIPPADSALKAQGKTFEHHVYDGATHGFLRAQGGANGANLKATKDAWPTTIAWLHKYLGA
jgi:carboxymethylenebutenolidase